MEQNQNRNFYRYIFNSIFLLTRHSSVFQIMFWNWNTWSTAKCRIKNSFDTWCYLVICATFCARFSSKSKATNVEGTWSIKWSNEDILLSRDNKELYVVHSVLDFVQKTWRHNSKGRTPLLTLPLALAVMSKIYIDVSNFLILVTTKLYFWFLVVSALFLLSCFKTIS